MPQYCSVTAKKSLKWLPFLGWYSELLEYTALSQTSILLVFMLLVALSGTVFIDRSNRRTAMAAFDGAAAQMQRDRVLSHPSSQFHVTFR